MSYWLERCLYQIVDVSCKCADQQLFIDLPENPAPGHKFCGHYFKWPDEPNPLGLVSSIQEDPPLLNWIFSNSGSHMLEYGGRKDSADHVIGPWGWTEGGQFLTLKDGHEAFAAVEMSVGGGKTLWAVCWDPDGAVMAQVGEEKCKSIRLRRKPLMGIDSAYVRGDKNERVDKNGNRAGEGS